MESAVPIWKTFPYGDFFLNSQMGMNSVWEWLVTEPFPIWKRGCVNPRFHMGISVWKQGAISFDPHMETRTLHFHMGICHSPFPCGDPHMWSPYENGLFPFPYGDVSIPVSIWRFLYGNPYGIGYPEGEWNRECNIMVCATKKTLKHQCKLSVGLHNFARLLLDGVHKKYKILGARLALDGVRAVGNYDGHNFWWPPTFSAAAKILPNFLADKLFVHDSMAGRNYSPHFHTGSLHMETCRPTKKFPFGDSPFPNRVCAYLGINIDTDQVFLWHWYTVREIEFKCTDFNYIVWLEELFYVNRPISGMWALG